MPHPKKALFDWLFGRADPAEDFGPGSVQAEPVKTEPVRRSDWAEGADEITASKQATERRTAACQAALAAYTPTKPAFRIVQRPAGHFEIEHRRVLRADAYEGAHYGFLGSPRYLELAEKIDARPIAPVEYFEVVRNDQAPIKTTEYGYGPYGRDTERLVGYAPLAFNIFADAEAYLKRMADPTAITTEYDFPPLKKRAAKKAAS